MKHICLLMLSLCAATLICAQGTDQLKSIGASLKKNPLQTVGSRATVVVDERTHPPTIYLFQDKWYDSDQKTVLREGVPIRLAPGKRIAVVVLSGGSRSNRAFMVTRNDESGPTAMKLEAPSGVTIVPLSGTSAFVLTHESELRVPKTGTIRIVVPVKSGAESDDNPDIEITFAPAERWEYDDTFSPYFTFSSGESPKFAAATTPIVFGTNHRFRLDAVAAFDLNGDEHFLGQALTYSILLGTNFKETGTGVFRFPVRVTISLGLQGWSFDQRQFGSGRPFLGFGISIPTGDS